MNRSMLLTVVVSAFGCEAVIVGAIPHEGLGEDEAGDLVDSSRVDPTDIDENGQPYTPGPRAVPKLPSTAVCQSAPAGRGYRGLAGEALEQDRADVAPLVDNHRTFRNVAENSGNWTVVTEIGRSLGIPTDVQAQDPELKLELRDPGVGAAFGVVRGSWFEESEVGAFAVYVTFQYAFKACNRAFGLTGSQFNPLRSGWYEHTAFEPTLERAKAFCERTERAAWMRTPTQAEIDGCAQLALSLTAETDVKKRWSYVCASVFASPNFLAN